MEQHWHTSEHATAIKYRVLASGTADGYKDQLVARVGVSSEYVAPLVDRAFALHPAMYTVITDEDDDDDQKELPDLIVRGALLLMLAIVYHFIVCITHNNVFVAVLVLVVVIIAEIVVGRV